MTTALSIAEQLAAGQPLSSKTILEELKKRYVVAYLEKEFFDQMGKRLFKLMNKEDQAELVALQDRELANTYEAVEKFEERAWRCCDCDDELRSALSEWRGVLGFPYGCMKAEKAA